jgi:putative endonuclease
MEYRYFVYILTNDWKNVVYVGVTNSLIRRVAEHKNGFVDGFTKKYRVKNLVYYEETSDVYSAIEREKEIKGWKRFRKNLLINGMNPAWRDLSEKL